MTHVVDISLPEWTAHSSAMTLLLAQLRPAYRMDSELIRQEPDARYLGAIRAALDLAARERVTISCFPEYTCPRCALPEMLERLDAGLVEQSACLLPMEHLPVQTLPELLRTVPLHPQCSPESVLEEIDGVDHVGGVVNLAFLFVRLPSGLVAIPQLKLLPAALEEAMKSHRFIRGDQIRRVNGAHLKLAALTCFDFVGYAPHQQDGPMHVLGMHELDLLLVPECNPKPTSSYYRASLAAAYNTGAWRPPNDPRVAFCNVAAGTRLAGLPDAFGGFSRIVGRLGTIDVGADPWARPLAGLPQGDGVTLADIGVEGHPDPQLRTLLLRPEPSAVVLELNRAGRDPTAGRVNTKARLHRVTTSGELCEARTIRLKPVAERAPGVPEELVPQKLEGVDLSAMSDAILRVPYPIVLVDGRPGAGKTAMVAKVSSALSTPFAVAWVDCENLEYGAGASGAPDPLVATILRRMGLAQALNEPKLDAVRSLRLALQSAPYIVVLDSFEKLKSAPVVLLTDLATRCWPSRFVVVSRRDPAPLNEWPRVTVEPISEGQFHAIASRAAETEVPRSLTDLTCLRLRRASPLVANWLGAYLRQRGGSGDELRAKLDASTDLDDAGFLAWCLEGLDKVQLDVLAALCALPDAVGIGDLAGIVRTNEAEVTAAGVELEARSLVTIGHQGLHVRHPFVRQHGTLVLSRLGHDPWPGLVEWAAEVVRGHGGDRHWDGHRHLEARWRNLRSVLTRLSEGSDIKDRALFLELWRGVDYFLWSTAGRRHERLALGEIAAHAARQAGDQRSLVHALYSSIAETDWHLLGDEARDLQLLDEAYKLAKEAGLVQEQSYVLHYRSRLLRQRGRCNEALAAGTEAVRVAREHGAAHAEGLALNAVANVLRTTKQYDDALEHYRMAVECFETAPENDAEMMAVVERNIGRTLVEAGRRLPEAFRRLERAAVALGDLGLEIEQAECALHHVSALVANRELDEAKWELDAVERVHAPLGSKVRNEEIGKLRERLARARSGA